MPRVSDEQRAEMRRLRFALLDALWVAPDGLSVPQVMDAVWPLGLFPEEAALRDLVRRLKKSGVLVGSHTHFQLNPERFQFMPSRRMLPIMTALLDGREWTSNDLADLTGGRPIKSTLLELTRSGWVSSRWVGRGIPRLLYRVTPEGARIFGHPLPFWARIEALLMTFAALSGTQLQVALDVPTVVVKVLLARFTREGRLELRKYRRRTVGVKQYAVKHYALADA